MNENRPIPGIFLVEQDASLGQIILDLLLIVDASEQSEWDELMYYLPL
jgi:hypothetical protein